MTTCVAKIVLLAHRFVLYKAVPTPIDPEIHRQLTEQGMLIRIDGSGNPIDDGYVPDEAAEVLHLLGPIELPIAVGEVSTNAQWYVSARQARLSQLSAAAQDLASFYQLAASTSVNSVLKFGDPDSAKSPLVRIHSCCLTGDVFGSQRCDCRSQYVAAVERMVNDANGGYIIYMAGHEGRGIGLWAKAAAYLLQHAGQDTYEANQSLGFAEDARDFRDAAALLKFFRADRGFRLLTNNPKKVEGLAALGVGNVERVKHVVGLGDQNRRYLVAKRDRGHQLSEQDLES